MKELTVVIPRMSNRRLSTLLFAKQKAKEGYVVTIHDIGGQDIIFKQKEQKNDNASGLQGNDTGQ